MECGGKGWREEQLAPELASCGMLPSQIVLLLIMLPHCCLNSKFEKLLGLLEMNRTFEIHLIRAVLEAGLAAYQIKSSPRGGPAIAIFWGMNECIQDHSVCISLSMLTYRLLRELTAPSP